MYICYMDESGDPGQTGSPTQAYAVSAILVKDSEWSTALDDVVDYRRWLRDTFGLRMRAEIKANELVKGSGPWKDIKIGEKRRHDIFRGLLRLQAKMGSITTFAVVITKASRASTDEVRLYAWENMFNRLEVFSRKNHDTMLLVPDVGEYEYRRALARKMRRFAVVSSRLGTAALKRPFVNLVEDPVARKSHESYFIQLADLNAYAAHRRIFPTPRFPSGMWENLDSAILAAANMYSGGPAPGIVWRP